MKTRGGRLCLGRNVGGLRMENAPRNTSLTSLEKKNYKKRPSRNYEWTTIQYQKIKNLDNTIEKYYQGIYSSESNWPENDFDGFIERLETDLYSRMRTECKSIQFRYFQADKTPGDDDFNPQFY